MSRSRLAIVALVSLVATALLSVAVSRGFSAFRLERHATNLLYGTPRYGYGYGFGYGFSQRPTVESWAHLADVLAAPVIGAVVVVCLVFGAFKRVVWRVGAGIALALLALVMSDSVVKPLVQEKFHGSLSFPSGNVTAVCATALAMWIALYPVLGRWSRIVTFAAGACWTSLMSVAVVAAFWHTPLDAIGAVFLSVGIVTAGFAVFPRKTAPTPSVATDQVRIPARV